MLCYQNYELCFLPSAICDIAPLGYPYHEYDMMKCQFLEQKIIENLP